MRVKITKSTNVENTVRVQQMAGIFDVPLSEVSTSAWDFELPIEDFNWKIGLVVGPSGSGKTTVIKEAFKNAPFVTVGSGYDWPQNKSLVDGFPEEVSIKDITSILSSVGFSSPPSWVRPYSNLSTGEQFRVTVARAICDSAPLIVIDEFTSVIDRTVAKIGSAAVNKAVKRLENKKIVAASCHYDIIDWLCPDWVLEMPSGEFTRRRLRRPQIEIEVRRVDRELWQVFKKHHYLDTSISGSSRCFAGFYQGQPVVFTAIIMFPHAVRPQWKEHRTVCLPDFQGVGIGNKFSEFVGGVMLATGRPYSSTTANPAMIRHRSKSPLWKMTRQPSLNSRYSSTMKGMKVATNRLTASFEYIGQKNIKDAIGYGIIEK